MMNLRTILSDARVKTFIDYQDLSGLGVVDFINIIDRAAAGTLGCDESRPAKKVTKKVAKKRAARRA